MSVAKSIALEIVGLQSARGRLIFFAGVSGLIYITPISMLANLSVWKHLGIAAPSVGLTRAYHYMLHGNIAAAYQQNRLIFIVLCVGLPLLMLDAYRVILAIRRKHTLQI